MRELLINKSNNPIEIPENGLGRNDYIKNVVQSTDHRISIEVSPNSDFHTDILGKLCPRFVAVTWLGNTHLDFPTPDIPAIILAKQFCDRDFPVLLHLAGRNIGKARMLEILTHIKNVGVKNVLALQGDRSHVIEQDDSKCDFPYASDLVSFIKDSFGDTFCVGVAGFPNVHPQCATAEEEMKYLKQKVSHGADFIVTQAAFEYEALENFAINCRKHEINVPILPGIFVVKSYKALIRMAKCCEVNVPKNVLDFVEKNQENEEINENYGLELAADLIRKCLNNKELFAGVHIFSMNDMEGIERVLSRL